MSDTIAFHAIWLVRILEEPQRDWRKRWVSERHTSMICYLVIKDIGGLKVLKEPMWDWEIWKVWEILRGIVCYLMIDLGIGWTGLEDKRSWRNTRSWDNRRGRQWPPDGWSIFCIFCVFAKEEVELATWNCIVCTEIYDKVLTRDCIDWKEWIKARENLYLF